MRFLRLRRFTRKAEESRHYILPYSPKMMNSTLMILMSVTTMAVLSSGALSAPFQCNPGILDELPPRLRKICIAVARIWDVRDMNDFVDDRGNSLIERIGSLCRRTRRGANDSLIYLMNDESQMSCKCARTHAPLPSLLAIINVALSAMLTYTLSPLESSYASFEWAEPEYQNHPHVPRTEGLIAGCG